MVCTMKMNEIRKQLGWCGLSRENKRINLRICLDHKFQIIKKYVHIKICDKDRNIVLKLIVPKASTISFILSTTHSRVSIDKSVIRVRFSLVFHIGLKMVLEIVIVYLQCNAKVYATIRKK